MLHVNEEKESITNPEIGMQMPVGEEVSAVRPDSRQPRWSLGFVAMLLYLFVEYMRLSAQYAFLRAYDIGKVAVVLGLLGWLIAPRVPIKRPAARLIDVAILTLALAAFISACFATYQSEAWTSFLDILRWVAIYFLIGRIVSSCWRMKVFVFLFLLLNLKMAQAAIRNFHHFQSSGLDPEYLAHVGIGAGSVGFFANGSDLGVAMCVVLPLAGILLLGEKKLILRLILLASFVGFFGAIVVCGSRGAVVGAAAAALLAWARNPRRLGSVFLFLLFIPAIYYVLPEASKARFETVLHPQKDSTATSRIEFWKAGLRMFEDNPVLGVGPGNFPLNYFEKYRRPSDLIGKWEPHNIFMQALSELGLAGTIPVLLLMFGCFRLNARTRRCLMEHGGSKPRNFDYYMALGLDMGLVGYMVSGTFLTVLYYPHLWVILGMSVGLHTAVTARLSHASESATEVSVGDYALAGSTQGRP